MHSLCRNTERCDFGEDLGHAAGFPAAVGGLSQRLRLFEIKENFTDHVVVLDGVDNHSRHIKSMYWRVHEACCGIVDNGPDFYSGPGLSMSFENDRRNRVPGQRHDHANFCAGSFHFHRRGSELFQQVLIRRNAGDKAEQLAVDGQGLSDRQFHGFVVGCLNDACGDAGQY